VVFAKSKNQIAMQLINRLKYNWSFIRILFVGMGITILIQALTIMQWPGIFLGGYFLTMGILGLGCASGNCSIPANTTKVDENKIETIEYTEVK
jgi:hypothetical protein